MKKNSEDDSAGMVEVTFRLPRDEAGELDRAAEASLINRSEYIRFLLRGRPVVSDVGLAALRRLIQIHGLVQAREECGELNATLRELIPVLAKAVRHRLV